MPKLTAKTLTERSVLDAEPGSKPYIYVWDAKVVGLGARVRKSGRIVWVFRWLRQGRQRIDELGVFRDGRASVVVMPLGEARKVALALRVSIDRNEEPHRFGVSINSPRLLEVWPKYVAAKRDMEGLAASTLRVYESSWSLHVCSSKYGIASMRCAEVKRMHVINLRHGVVQASRAEHANKIERARQAQSVVLAKLERQASVAGNGAANRVVALVSSIYSWMIASGLAETNPCEGVAALPTAGRDKETVLTRNDALEVIDLVREYAPTSAFRDALLLVMLTIQRDSDIRERTWDDLVLDDPDVPMPYLRIRKHKSMRRTKQAKLVPLAPEAVAILLARHPGAEGMRAVGERGQWQVVRGSARWPIYPSAPWAAMVGEASGPIFPSEKDPSRPLPDLWHGWEPCRRHAKSKRVQVADVHGLRHAGASLMRAAGVPRELIGDALHHSDASTTEIYLQRTFEFWERLGQALGPGLGLALK